jgi:chromosome segregation ATPase
LLNAKFEQYGKTRKSFMEQHEHEKRRAELFAAPKFHDTHVRNNMDETIYTADQLSQSLDKTSSIFNSGRDTLNRLMTQNETVRSAMSHTQDVGNAIGLSRSTMRTIERHIQTDRWLTIGGIVFIILFFLLLLMYF